MLFFIQLLYGHLQHHKDTIIIARRRTSLTKYTSHFICKGSKRLLKVCVWEGAGDRTETAIFWPHCYGHQHCVFHVLLMLNRRPRGPLCWWWLSLLHLISIFSGPQLIRAPSPFGLMWLSLPHLVYNSVRSSTARPLQPDVALPTTSRLTPTPTLTGNVLTSVFTELYNSSTPTQSPTRSLKSHVWSSSSENNCHVVHRSLSSDASVYECTMGIILPRSAHAISAHAISSHNCH